MASTIFEPAGDPPADQALSYAGPAVGARPGGRAALVAALRRHRALALTLLEAAVALLVLVLVGIKVPGLVSSIGHNLARLRHPSPLGLGLALGSETVALVAAAVVPRLLLRRHGVPLGRRDALAIGVAANGLAVVVPGGAVPSSVWLARQLNRRGAPATLAAWSVLAGGFSAAATLVILLIVGAGIAGVVSPSVAGILGAFVLVGSAGFLAAVHRVDQLARWATPPGTEGMAAAAPPSGTLHRLAARFASLAAEASHWRAGWRTGAGVLTAATVNWLADAGCLVAVFSLVRAPIPWRSVLVAFAAGQLLGALIPLPGGLGVVEGGLVGTLVALGSPAATVVAVVTIYRLVGYWLPAAAALPAYSWARRHLPA